MAAKILMTSFLVGMAITTVGFTASVQGWQTVNMVASRLMVPVVVTLFGSFAVMIWTDK